MAIAMSELCIHLMTKVKVVDRVDALERVWSIDNWTRNLHRVLKVETITSTEKQHHFQLFFDAGGAVPDRIEVERIRIDNSILVKHISPPPGIKSLSAVWWYEAEIQEYVFARRTLFIDSKEFSREKVRHMFGLLRENFLTLVNGDSRIAIS